MFSRRLMLQMALLALPFARAHAQSDGLALLAQFLQSVRTGRATFTQVVTAVPRAGQVPRQRTSSGVLEFQRPGRFRFSYQKPYEQTLVADGQTLWLHDPDLQQVTARAQAQALASTPLALVVGSADLGALQREFVLQAEPGQAGLQWVTVTPRLPDGQIRQARLGLRLSDQGPQLGVLELLDALGQRSVLTFSGFEINPTLRPESFVFRVPAGTDVIRP